MMDLDTEIIDLDELDDDYDYLVKFGLATEESLKELKDERDKFVKELRTGEKTLAKYGECIVFEKKINSFINDNAEKLGENHSLLQNKIATRIIDLYRESLFHFSSEYVLWMAYIIFCKRFKPKEVSPAYKKFLKVHSKEEVWGDYALWLCQYEENFVEADRIIAKLLIEHPDSEKSLLAQFRVTLAYSAKLNREKSLKDLKEIFELYIKIRNKFKNHQLLIDMLISCETDTNCIYTIRLQKMIVDDLKNMFPDNENVLDNLAKRELRGFCNSDLNKLEMANDIFEINEINLWEKRDIKDKIELCCKAYENYIATVKPEQILEMYIKTMKTLYSDAEVDKKFSWKGYIRAIKCGHKLKLLNAEKYCEFFGLVVKDDKFRTSQIPEKIFDEIPKDLPNLEKILYIWFSGFYNRNGEEKLMHSVLRIGRKKQISTLKLLPLWEYLILHYETHPKNISRYLQMTYREASKVQCAAYRKFRVQYLEWCLRNYNMEQTRTEYDKLAILEPPYLELHQRMAKIEAIQFEPDIKRWRMCYQNAVKCFEGEVLPLEFWKEYLNFEGEYGEREEAHKVHELMKNNYKNVSV